MDPTYYTDSTERAVWLFDHRISWWLIFAHVAFVAGCGLAVVLAGRHRVSRARLLLLLPAIYLLAAVMGHAFSVFFDGNWGHYRRHPAEALTLARGGFVLYGGLVGAVGAALIGTRLLRLRFWATADACAAGTALGLAIARVGCFFQACCHGKPTTSPLGVEYRNFALSVRPIGVPLHPAALYEAAGLLVIAGWLLVRDLRRPRGGEHGFVLLLALYAPLRFLVEIFRADARGGILGLSTSQAISVLVFPLALAAWRYAGPPANRGVGTCA
jgi:phosphatidylglycerol---prolipoprotein diacylglyceryl transferase